VQLGVDDITSRDSLDIFFKLLDEDWIVQHVRQVLMLHFVFSYASFCVF